VKKDFQQEGVSASKIQRKRSRFRYW